DEPGQHGLLADAGEVDHELAAVARSARLDHPAAAERLVLDRGAGLEGIAGRLVEPIDRLVVVARPLIVLVPVGPGRTPEARRHRPGRGPAVPTRPGRAALAGRRSPGLAHGQALGRQLIDEARRPVELDLAPLASKP